MSLKDQLEYLNIHRRNLALYLKRAASKGTNDLPPEVANGIIEERLNIAHVKDNLRQYYKIEVADEPTDFAPTDDKITVHLQLPKNYTLLAIPNDRLPRVNQVLSLYDIFIEDFIVNL